jgi:hypothetical protein
MRFLSIARVFWKKENICPSILFLVAEIDHPTSPGQADAQQLCHTKDWDTSTASKVAFTYLFLYLFI